MPALLPQMSRPPSAAVFSASERSAFESVMSSSTTSTVAPVSLLTSDATRVAAVMSLSAMMTRAPASAYLRVIAAPIPLPPPVTTAVFPASEKRFASGTPVKSC